MRGKGATTQREDVANQRKQGSGSWAEKQRENPERERITVWSSSGEEGSGVDGAWAENCRCRLNLRPLRPGLPLWRLQRLCVVLIVVTDAESYSGGEDRIPA